MTLIRFIFTFSLVTLLLLFSQSPPTSAAATDGHGNGIVLIPFRRVLLQSQAVKAGAKVVGDGRKVDEPTYELLKKLGIHMRKVRGGGVAATPGGRGPRGKTSSSSSAVGTQLFSFGLAAVLGCSLLLGFILL